MFANVGWGEMFIIALVALVVLGPERLPEAARWLAGTVRKVKQFASDAQNQLKDDFGTDFDEIRKPLAELNNLRGMSPRSLVTKHLLDGDDSLFTGNFDTPDAGQSVGGAASATATTLSVGGTPVQQPQQAARSTKDVFRQEAARQSASSQPTAPAGGEGGAAGAAGAGYGGYLDDAT